MLVNSYKAPGGGPRGFSMAPIWAVRGGPDCCFFCCAVFAFWPGLKVKKAARKKGETPHPPHDPGRSALVFVHFLRHQKKKKKFQFFVRATGMLDSLGWGGGARGPRFFSEFPHCLAGQFHPGRGHFPVPPPPPPPTLDGFFLPFCHC